MSSSYTPGLKVLASTKVLKTRLLPMKGHVHYKVGDNVESSDVIASTEIPGNVHMVNASKQLNIEPEIAQSMIYGDYKNYLVAIIVPDNDFSKQWADLNNKTFSLAEISKNNEFYNIIKKVVERVNKNLSVIEQVRKFIIIDHEFTIENEMMTPTLKVRRFVVKEKYGKQLEELY